MENPVDKKAAQREKAIAALQKLHEARGSGFRKMFLTPEGMTKQAMNVIMMAVLLRFVLPWLPGIDFVGTFGDAIVSAFMVIVVALATVPLFRVMFERLLGAIAEGREVSGWQFVGFFAGMYAIPVIDVWAMTWPGYLFVHGFFGWVFAVASIFAAGWLGREAFARIWPQTKKDEATAEEQKPQE